MAAPLRLQIEPVSYCNLKCHFCVISQKKRSRKTMAVGDLLQIVESSGAKWIQLSGVGETFLHPEISATMFGIKSMDKILKITTNGLSLSEKIARSVVDAGVDFVDVSIDTTQPDLYKKIRGASPEKVIGNVKRLCDYRDKQKSRLVVSAKHVYNDDNIRHLPQDIRKLDTLPFDYGRLLGP
jgi:MoaA/NifB/PqqE/SkfB family radical SAM enzyme